MSLRVRVGPNAFDQPPIRPAGPGCKGGAGEGHPFCFANEAPLIAPPPILKSRDLAFDRNCRSSARSRIITRRFLNIRAPSYTYIAAFQCAAAADHE